MDVVLFRDYPEECWHSMEVYADQLVAGLRELAIHDLSVREHITLPAASRLFPPRYKYVRQAFRYIVNPLGAMCVHGDVFHISDHANSQLLAVLDPCRTVVTCHDLTAPYWMETYVPLTFKKRVRHAVEKWRLGFMKRAARIIAVSEATKTHIVSVLRIPEERIVVIPEGVDPLFRPALPPEWQRISKMHRVPTRYILHVGTTYTNKNIEGLIRLFSSLARTDRELFLVKTGDPWTAEQEDLIRRSPCHARIRHIGFVDTRDLPGLYSSARALVQPSFAEGFGFPVLEAMACGCPVIASDLPALRELAAGAALYIRPDISADDIARVKSVLRSGSQLREMQSAGIRRARRYSWRHTAVQTYRVYQDVIAERKAVV